MLTFLNAVSTSREQEYISKKGVEESGISKILATVVMSFKLSIGKAAIRSEEMYSNEVHYGF